jgi:hypothetical protein
MEDSYCEQILPISSAQINLYHNIIIILIFNIIHVYILIMYKILFTDGVEFCIY